MIEATPTGVRLRVRVQPRASRTELVGLHGGALKVRLGRSKVVAVTGIGVEAAAGRLGL